jgi:hypothetical protein
MMAFQLLQLPDDCLVCVLRCLAAGGHCRSLFSAARAHSRLHVAAAAALRSVHDVLMLCSEEEQVEEQVLLTVLLTQGEQTNTAGAQL